MDTLDRLLPQLARTYGPRPALLHRPGYRAEIWSYARLAAEAEQVAGRLRQQGVAKGDRVVLWAPNSPAWVAAFFGTLRLGAVVVPLDVRSSPDFVHRVVAQTAPRLVLHAPATPWNGPAPSAELDRLVALPDPDGSLTDPDLAPDDIAEILFTSGTTGDPKGVILTHGNIRANVESVIGLMPADPTCRLLSILPLSHMFEQTLGLLAPLCRGAAVYYPASLQPPVLRQALQEGAITAMLVVPQALQILMDGIEREVQKQGRAAAWARLTRLAGPLPFPLRRLLFRNVRRRIAPRLRFFVCGGAPLAPALIRKWEGLGIRVLQGYGTTEAAPVLTALTLRDNNPQSVGRAVPGVHLRLAPDGEVLARGSNITPGYWQNPAATASAFVDGWYRTGDLGHLDGAGYLYLHGRKGERIVLANGQNVYPDDVEGALRAVGAAADLVVIGLPTPQGTQVHAVFLPDPLAAPDQAETDSAIRDPQSAIRAANAHLAAHQQIAGYTIWPAPEFPRTHTLKVKKHEVVAAVLARQGDGAAPVGPAPAAQPDRAVARTVAAVVAEVAGLPAAQLGPDATLAEAGLDSLGRVALLAALETELGLCLDDTQVGPDTTLRELEALARAGAPPPRPHFPAWPRSRPAVVARAALQAPAFALLDLLAPPRVSGRAGLADLAGPVLFVANHTSHLDTLVVLGALPGHLRRRIAVAAAADYFFSRPALGAGVALLCNAFPFARTGSIRPALAGCARLFDAGWSILLYPEGTRAPGGALGAFQPGAGLLAVELGVPVVPVYLDGLGAVLPKGRHIPRPGRVAVRFGAPLLFPAGTAYAEAAGAMEAAVRGLAEDAAGSPAHAKGETHVGYLWY